MAYKHKRFDICMCVYVHVERGILMHTWSSVLRIGRQAATPQDCTASRSLCHVLNTEPSTCDDSIIAEQSICAWGAVATDESGRT